MRASRPNWPQTLIGREGFFHRHGDVESSIDGFINRAHPATAKPFYDAVTALQHCAACQKRRPGVGVQSFLHFSDRLATTVRTRLTCWGSYRSKHAGGVRTA
jgi:hypothetical protein